MSDGLLVGRDALGLIVEPDQAGQLRGARFERVHQNAVFDVVAERIEADLVGGKAHLRRADQPPGIVDQPHCLQCRGPVLAAPPHIEFLQEVDGRAEQRSGAIVGIGDATRDQRRLRAGLSQRDRGRKSGRTAADHRNIRGNGHVLIPVTIDMPSGIFNPATITLFRATDGRNIACTNKADS